MKLNFVTSNKNKVKEVQRIVGKGYILNHIFMKYPELRSDYSDEIAESSAKQLADKLNKTIIVEDSGLFIKGLNGFPGTSSAYIHKRIGLQGILKLMKNIKNREARYISAVAYCEPGKKPVSFLGVEKGKIANKIRGKYGFGHDSIFIPQRNKKTYGEMKNADAMKKFRKQAVHKLIKYLRTKKVKK